MARKLTEDEAALVQAEITRMSNGYEKPLNSLVAEQISRLHEALGFENRAVLLDSLRLSPYSTLFTGVRNLAAVAVFPDAAEARIEEVLALYQGETEKPSVNEVIASRLLQHGTTPNVAAAFSYSDQEFADGLRLRPFSTLLTMIVRTSDLIA